MIIGIDANSWGVSLFSGVAKHNGNKKKILRAKKKHMFDIFSNNALCKPGDTICFIVDRHNAVA